VSAAVNVTPKQRPRRCVGAAGVSLIPLLALVLSPSPATAATVPVRLLPPGAWASAVPLAHSDLSRALEHWATDPAGLAVDPGTTAGEYLAGYLSQLASLGPGLRPELFPTDQHILAYLVNAHVAWTLALASDPSNDGLDAAAVRRLPFTLGHQSWTLASLADEVLRRAPLEPRLALCLNPGFLGGPPLPLAALEGHSLEWQIAEHARTCGRSRGFWEFDGAAGALRVSGFTAFLPGLPAQASARARRLLDLVPPRPEDARAILARCGRALQRCTVTVAPMDFGRWSPRHAPPTTPAQP